MRPRPERGTFATFAKQVAGRPAIAYEVEAAGFAWLGEVEDGCPVPRVHSVGVDRLVIDRIETSPPSERAAHELGRALATTHRAGADHFGSLPPGPPAAFIASLPLPLGEWDTFGSFYAEARLRPLADLAVNEAALDDGEHALVIALAEAVEDQRPEVVGPPEPVARVHGDLWSGNVLWRRRSCVLIDPSAHGGHRESDLAMLALFGLPHLDDVIAAYDDEWPLAPGWRERIALHQVYPLLVHAILFGGSYGAAAASAARRALGGT